jgi:hypothetical protein
MKSLLALLLFFVSIQLFGQWGQETLSDKPSFRDRVFVGGGIGGGFGSTMDYFSISPIIGYKLTEKLVPGVSFMYRYVNNKYYNPSVSTYDYGVSPYLRYMLGGGLFLHTEYEFLNYQYLITPTESVRKGYSSFLAGGGFFQPFGRRAGFFATILYNFSYSNSNNGYYPYSSPVIYRMGITAGF